MWRHDGVSNPTRCASEKQRCKNETTAALRNDANNCERPQRMDDYTSHQQTTSPRVATDNGVVNECDENDCDTRRPLPEWHAALWATSLETIKEKNKTPDQKPEHATADANDAQRDAQSSAQYASVAWRFARSAKLTAALVTVRPCPFVFTTAV